MHLAYGFFIAVSTILISSYSTRRAINWSLRHSVLDLPNARSSHSLPTPRGGGLGIVAAFTAGLLALALRGIFPWSTTGALSCAYAVALVGYLDDQHSLSVAKRLAVQTAAAITALTLLSPLPTITLFGQQIPVGFSELLYFFGLLWLTNLYNFMDGIDGIAGAQAVAVCTVWMMLAIPHDSSLLPAVLAAAALGFLRYNWPPAKVFMGDVGSAFLGFTLGVASLAMASTTRTEIGVWLIPLAGFIGDSTATLCVRIAHRINPSEPHRNHLYQLLSRRWKSHARVTLLYSGITLFILGPIAILVAKIDPQRSNDFFSAAAIAMTILSVSLGAGRDNR